MSTLLMLQDQFQKFITFDHPEISGSIVETETVSVETRLGIYKNAYTLRLIESLNTSFPALYAYLGTEEFEKLCHSYIKAHPSPYRSIRWYGDVLADFIKTYFDASYAYLAELADFEWNMTLAFDAADDKVLTIDEMAAVNPELWADMTFTVHSSVRRVNYFWNSVSLWQTLIKDEDLPEMLSNSRPLSWVLWRSPDFMIQYYSLSEEEAWALDALRQGKSFGELCEGLCQWVAVEEVGMKAASYLKNWIQNGMLSRLLL